MTDPAGREADGPVAAPRLQLEGFEGPLDLLLELARTQKVDLARISILQLVEQYLAVVEASRQLRLELAADWLVMAAWLAWLKSRLLLPADDAQGEEGAVGADRLAARLADLAHAGRLAGWLGSRDQLGHQVFARGDAENLHEIDRSGFVCDLPRLLGAYLTVIRRNAKTRTYRPKQLSFWTMQDALSRLRLMLGSDIPGWCRLTEFLPEWLASDAPRVARADVRSLRAAMAGTLLAGLELARSGLVELQQDEPFGSILLRRAEIELLQQAAE